MANGVTSEWEDIHVKLGNYLPREKEVSSEEIYKESIEKEAQKDINAGKSLEQLNIEREENLDSDDDEVLKAYQEKRLAELKEYASKPKYGRVIELRRQDYKDQVNNAPKGVWVVILLYQNPIIDSKIMEQIWEDLAKKYVLVKFMKIVANNCIEGIQEQNIPGVIIYHDGQLVRQFIPAPVFFGGKGKISMKSKSYRYYS